MSDTPRRVRFRGMDFVVVDGALAPVDHVDEDGCIKIGAALFGDSYAHICRGGVIKRFGQEIGTVKDLVPQ